MHYIIRYFPEIALKSRPVRMRLVRQLQRNLRRLLGALDKRICVTSAWDRLDLRLPDEPGLSTKTAELLARTPGIANFLEVEEYPLGSMEEMLDKVQAAFGDEVAGHSFAVRCRRSGQHDFNSQDVERSLGRGLLCHAPSARVDLRSPEVMVRLEIRDQRLFLVRCRREGLGGFPLGSLGSVLSLVSGGFDSTAASYHTMRRGLLTHFCLFSLGGRRHETAVREVADSLWRRFGASHPVRFITVPFEEMSEEILRCSKRSYMGIVLKRAMLKAASQIASRLEIGTLVTGDSVAQVSSQTLINLEVVDQAADRLVFRPLAASDKRHTIATVAEIGLEPLCARMPEYCSIFSARPCTKSRLDKIQAEEARCDAAVLERALAAARFSTIDGSVPAPLPAEEKTAVEVLQIPQSGSVIIDLRHPQESHRRPLRTGTGVQVLTIPFYELSGRFAELDSECQYLLYCERGTMSQLHADRLLEQGYRNVGVFRPPMTSYPGHRYG